MFSIYFLPFIIIEAIILSNSFIKCTTTCKETCKTNYTNSAQCLRKPTQNLILECGSNYDVVNFIRKNDNQYISGYNIQFYSDDYNYSIISNEFNKLVINNLRRIDSGSNSFQSFNIFNKNETCNFSVYLYGICLFFYH
jgi:hypothetical protein